MKNGFCFWSGYMREEEMQRDNSQSQTPDCSFSPFPIKIFNQIGTILRNMGIPLGHLTEDVLLERACSKTGLCDFGGDFSSEPLRLLLDACEKEAHLNLVGRLAARYNILRLLVNQLHLVEDGKRFPSIAREVIHRPIFIVGLPRTGSTFLHNLLAQDPNNRTPLTWEVLFPSPPPSYLPAKEDPRIAKTGKLLQQFDWLAPRFKHIHAMEATLPTECVAIMSHTFISHQFHTTWHVPSYQKWIEDGDARPAYAFHRWFLQHLQWQSPPRQWILKAPPHIFSLDDLLSVYPDALILHTHRDPLKVIGSVASLGTVLRSAFSDHVDPQAIGIEVMKQWTKAIQRAMNVRKKKETEQNRFLDVYYQDLVGNPMRTIQRIYSHCHLELTEQATTRMQGFLRKERSHNHSIHRYSLAPFGLTSEMVSAHFQMYTKRFHIEPEPV